MSLHKLAQWLEKKTRPKRKRRTRAQILAAKNAVPKIQKIEKLLTELEQEANTSVHHG